MQPSSFALLIYQKRKQIIIINNMKNQKRKRVLLDHIKEKDHSESDSGSKQKENLQSSGSSNFSDFQMESKDINNDFSEFKKPKLWAKVLQSKSRNQTDRNENQTRDKPKKKKSKVTKNEGDQCKNSLGETTPLDHLISFKKLSPEESKIAESPSKTKSNLKQNIQSIQNDSESQELIQEYDKAAFNNAPTRQEIASEKRALAKSRREERESKLNENGMVETAGGVSFQIRKSDFVYENEAKKKKKCLKTKKGHRGGRRKQSTPAVCPKQEILRRRRMAFAYGQLARRRTFGSN